ncbi:hypothetical protein CKF54_03710 [Psittacicella hinzii]|uniref:Uncharacterized protein n=1 Tax=Psittacicella hinzii TaxID=2028575 RepID=A0A3A1Y6S2_9GAMM|nr:hypothetical protein [Psittacicella hinzii]RIY32918.1 hypothetical protein CKF54_03710 [Psittacicella hinzii]
MQNCNTQRSDSIISQINSLTKTFQNDDRTLLKGALHRMLAWYDKLSDRYMDYYAVSGDHYVMLYLLEQLIRCKYNNEQELSVAKEIVKNLRRYYIFTLTSPKGSQECDEYIKDMILEFKQYIGRNLIVVLGEQWSVIFRDEDFNILKDNDLTTSAYFKIEKITN